LRWWCFIIRHPIARNPCVVLCTVWYKFNFNWCWQYVRVGIPFDCSVIFNKIKRQYCIERMGFYFFSVHNKFIKDEIQHQSLQIPYKKFTQFYFFLCLKVFPKCNDRYNICLVIIRVNRKEGTEQLIKYANKCSKI
jgi:hypothetical protein